MEKLGIILWTICMLYAIRQAMLNKPAFKLDYWIMWVVFLIGMFLVFNY